MQRLLSVILLLTFHSVMAQHYIRGEVKDEEGNILPNAAILQQSTGYVFSSGSSGAFGLPASKACDTLTFSLSGYQKLKLAVNTSDFITVVLKKAETGKISPYKLLSLTQNLKRDVQQQWFTGDETYASLVENHFINTSAYPSTGVSLNMDKASYSNIRRFLKNNAFVPSDAVRIEEMLNYFNFNYEEPAQGKMFRVKPLLTKCPWNDENQLLFINISSKKIKLDSLPPTNLVFLIDVSGSMDLPNRLPLLKSGFKCLVNNLRPIDSVSIVVYGGFTGVMLPPTGGAEKEKILNIIDSLTPGGSTPGEAGVKLAYRLAKSHYIRKGNNRVVLATDGDFNVGLQSEEDLEKMITEQRNAGIYLTCLGVGMGNYKDSKIQILAQKGNGNFAYIDTYAEAEKVLLKEFLQTIYTVADETYFKVQFNPSVVKEYRLIGFDNKAGAIKDTLATIEGGEIGSGYSALVVFEIMPVQKTIMDHLRPVRFTLQYQLPSNHREFEQTEEPEVSFTSWNNVDNSYQFASSVALFGMLLQNSRHAKNASWNDVLDIATQSANATSVSEQEFLTLVQIAKSIYGKKRRKNYW
ncbi:von Willebrand factor type A domain-containing protein [Chitinophagaceae bacterium LB-8]|uniref:von Willebrand factor type A domain-containing protein n=1 Tax=Paraflavisolibacter caeni TaxID=2982496 RepID=A0A9X2XUD9_9BACT|nr:von Willebrand factor type A domain-containing protein [Paraflavisolibacter caeni]MCU7548667.1 von Willebrand factor type A domain-containing protein [Paraflavisolibacter caeni]